MARIATMPDRSALFTRSVIGYIILERHALSYTLTYVFMAEEEIPEVAHPVGVQEEAFIIVLITRNLNMSILLLQLRE